MIFNRQRRRAEKELQEERSEKLRRKPSVTFQPENIIINDNDSEVVVKPKVQKNYNAFFPGLRVHRVQNVCGLFSRLIVTGRILTTY